MLASFLCLLPLCLILLPLRPILLPSLLSLFHRELIVGQLERLLDHPLLPCGLHPSLIGRHPLVKVLLLFGRLLFGNTILISAVGSLCSCDFFWARLRSVHLAHFLRSTKQRSLCVRTSSLPGSRIFLLDFHIIEQIIIDFGFIVGDLLVIKVVIIFEVVFATVIDHFIILGTVDSI